MSTPTDDYLACDDHQRVYLIGASCPDCDEPERAAYLVTRARVEARELARRWAWWHAFDTAEQAQAESNADLEEWLASIGEAERPLDDAERERLFAWVLDFVKTTWERTMADEGSAAPPDRILSPALSISMAEARDLFDAAKAANPGWPS